MARMSTVGAAIDGSTLFRGYHHAFEPEAKESSEVGFIDVDYAKTVEFEVVDFFQNHGGDDLVPPLERMTGESTKVEKRQMDIHDATRRGGHVFI